MYVQDYDETFPMIWAGVNSYGYNFFWTEAIDPYINSSFR